MRVHLWLQLLMRLIRSVLWQRSLRRVLLVVLCITIELVNRRRGRLEASVRRRIRIAGSAIKRATTAALVRITTTVTYSTTRAATTTTAATAAAAAATIRQMCH